MAVKRIKKTKTTRKRKSCANMAAEKTVFRKSKKRRVGVAKRKTTRRTRKKSLLDKILDF